MGSNVPRVSTVKDGSLMRQDQDKQEDLKSSFLKIEMLSSGPVVCIVEAGRVDEVISGQSMLESHGF